MTRWECRHCGHQEHQPDTAKEVHHHCPKKRGQLVALDKDTSA